MQTIDKIFYFCDLPVKYLMLRVQIPLGRGVLDTTLCNKVCQCLATGRWFSPPNITEILLKVSFKLHKPKPNLLPDSYKNYIMYSTVRPRGT